MNKPSSYWGTPMTMETLTWFPIVSKNASSVAILSTITCPGMEHVTPWDSTRMVNPVGQRVDHLYGAFLSHGGTGVPLVIIIHF